MVICAITLNSPYYDCDDEWTIKKHDQDWIKTPNGTWVTGYAYLNGTIHLGNFHKDRCGDSLVWHELNHVKYQTGSHDWNPDYYECDGFNTKGSLFGSKIR